MVSLEKSLSSYCKLTVYGHSRRQTDMSVNLPCLSKRTPRYGNLENNPQQKGQGPGDTEPVAPSPLQSSAWGQNGRSVPTWNHLDNFYKRYNKVGPKCYTSRYTDK